MLIFSGELYEKLVQSGESQTTVITKGIELYFGVSKSDPQPGLVQQLQLSQLSEELLKLGDARISDLKQHIQDLNDQLHTEDMDNEKLNGTIAGLNINIENQAYHIQSLISENSKLNMKLLPEITESKRPWWKIC